MFTPSQCLKGLVISSLALGAGHSCAVAADKASGSSTALLKKPTWLTDLSLTVKEAFDDNVFYSDVGPGSDLDSWVTTISPKIGVNFAPFIGDMKTIPVLSLGYAPEFNIYHSEHSESFNAHRMALTFKAKVKSVAVSFENGFNYIDGSQNGPIYLSGRNAYATASVRERREQIQDRLKFTLQYDQEKWFVRPNATLLYYDLLTRQRLPTGDFRGYDNYADRADVNGGVDFGYKVKEGFALTLGYRYGHQFQEQYSAAVDPAKLSSPSDYHRVLLGFEGKPWKWLTISFQAGPDFRTYEHDSENHVTPVDNLHPVKYYGEANVVADVTAKDSLTFKYRQWQWVASTGKLPYFDSSYDLTYRHKFSKKLSLDLSGKIQSSDYTWADVAAGNREDYMYTLAAGVSYAFTSELSATVGYALDLGVNAQDDLTSAQERVREFDHQVVSVGVTYKF